jgi:hypothetical protein
VTGGWFRRLTVEGWFRLAFGVFAILLLAASGIIYAQLTHARAESNELEFTVQPAQAQAYRLQGALLDQETGIRGYGITGDVSFLSPYTSGLATEASAAGQLRALAVTGAGRAAAAPEIPTIGETALPGFEATTWFALVAPAGTPRELRLRLNAEIKSAHAQADVAHRFGELGMTADDVSPEQLDEFIRSEIIKWARVIKDADIHTLE